MNTVDGKALLGVAESTCTTHEPVKMITPIPAPAPALLTTEEGIRKGDNLKPKELIELLDDIYPDLWLRFMPRVYKHTDRYCSVKLPAGAMISSVISAKAGMLKYSRPMKCVFLATDKIQQFNSQMIFISPELLKAAMLSNPPEGMKWMDLHLPFEAATLMLPRGSVKDSRGFEYDFISYCRRHVGERLSKDNEEVISRDFNERENPIDSFTSFTMASNGDGCILEAAWTPDMSPFITDLEIDPIIPASPVELILTEEDGNIIKLLTTLLFRICLILEARPTLLTSGKKVGSFSKRKGVEVWTPNVIGLNYKIKTEGLAVVGSTEKGSHASPRMHWRRGHTRHQPFGPRIEGQKQERKIIWLEPCLVGASVEAEGD